MEPSQFLCMESFSTKYLMHHNPKESCGTNCIFAYAVYTHKPLSLVNFMHMHRVLFIFSKEMFAYTVVRKSSNQSSCREKYCSAYLNRDKGKYSTFTRYLLIFIHHGGRYLLFNDLVESAHAIKFRNRCTFSKLCYT